TTLPPRAVNRREFTANAVPGGWARFASRRAPGQGCVGGTARVSSFTGLPRSCTPPGRQVFSRCRSFRHLRGEIAMTRRLLPLWIPLACASGLWVLFLVLPCRVRAADENPIVGGRVTSEWLELLAKYQAEKTSDEKEAVKNIQRCKVILDLLEINGPRPS